MPMFSLYRGGYTNVNSTETLDDFDELCDILSQVNVGQKNGDYVLRGRCNGDRSDSNMVSMDAIIIDGDQTLTTSNSCSPLEPVHEILKSQDIKHVIHSSYSQNIPNNLYKWRCYIPCQDLVDAGALKQGVAEVISLLHGNGIMVRNVKEDSVPSQPWFTPRCPEGFEDDFTCLWHDGEPWKLGKVGILPTASVHISSNGNGDGGGGSCFSWDWAIGQISSGTIHQSVKSICGWLISTTDWAPSQIKTYLTTLISALCPDPVKVKRAIETKEIDNLIQYCREHHGVIDNVANWKTNLTTAAELRDKEFPPIKWAVDNVIPEGLTVLAGDPKCGKSLVAVDICSAIASGGYALGNRKCVKGDCLYVSFEDPERRVKARIAQQCNLWPDKFKLLTGALSQLGESFYRQVDEMMLMWPDLRCMVVDTMQFIIPPKPQGVTDYDHMYRCLDPLHRWAINNHIAVILITHMAKSRVQDGDNPFAGIIGSVAIQGTSDSMILLRKNHAKEGLVMNDPDIPDGFLRIQGREMGTEHYALEFDHEALKWSINREAELRDTTSNSNWILITDVIKKKPMGAVEISSELKINKATVKSCLKRMLDKGLIVKVDKGVYGLFGMVYEEP